MCNRRSQATDIERARCNFDGVKVGYMRIVDDAGQNLDCIGDDRFVGDQNI